MKAKRFIDVTAETRKELMKIFKCSTMNVWRALNFESESDECRRIRVAALKKGGHIMTVALECETVHDEVGDKCMRQYFDNGAILEANKATGRTDIYDRMGVKRHTHEKTYLTDFERLQGIAQSL